MPDVYTVLPMPWSAEGRRVLGEIDGIEEEAGVRLLSASEDDPRPVLEVSVVDGLCPLEDSGVSLGYIDPRAMAELLIEHGYAAPAEGGNGGE